MQAIYRKARSIVEHVAERECRHVELSLAISDMATRVTRLDRAKQGGGDETRMRTLEKMLLDAGAEVVEAWREVREELHREDEELDIIVEDLDHRLKEIGKCV